MNTPMIHINEVARRFPQPSGKPRSTATVIRWHLSGVRSRGRIVKLGATRVGGAYYTTEEAIQRFIDTLNGPDVQTAVAPDSGSDQGNQSAVAASLDAEGL